MVNVIGLGYIGLPTALMMAAHGIDVVGTDCDKDLVATLNAGHTTFSEDGLEELFVEAVAKGVTFTTEYRKCDTYIVSVPTPYDKIDKRIDSSYVVSACKAVLEIAPRCCAGDRVHYFPQYDRPLCSSAARGGRSRRRGTSACSRAHHPRQHGL